MKLVRPGIVLASVALAIAVPLGAGAAASSSGVHPTVTLTGVVAGPTGVPLAGACVNLQTDPVPYTTTDAGGHYSFTGVQPSSAGTFMISVSPGCSTTDPLGPDYLSYTSGAITASTGAVTTANVTLTLGGSIAGKVFASNGNALYGACIVAVAVVGSVNAEGVSAINGSYLISGLPVGSYALTFSDCDNTLNVQSKYYDNVQTLSTASHVAITAGQTTALNSQTLPAAGSVALKVTDLQGNLIPGLTVLAFPEAPDSLNLGARSSNTPDSNGFYNFTDMLTMPYEFDYRYCAPGGSCRVGPIGYYQNRGPGFSPTLVTPSPGSTTTLHDAIAVPALYTSTTTVTPNTTPIAVGQNLQLEAHISDGAGNPFPSGLVYFEENGQVFGSSGLSSGLAYVPATLSVGTHVITAVYYGDGESTPSQGHTTVVVTQASGSGGSSGGSSAGSTGSSGSSGGGGAAAPAAVVTATVPAGGSVSSDPAGTTPNASNPLVVGVTSPTGGTVTIDKTPPDTAVAHYTVLGVGATITAPPATTADPLTLTFQVFDKQLPAGSAPADLTVFRDGVAVGACTGAGATPDPCVASAGTNGGVTTIVIRSSHASTWDVEAARVGRVSGTDRIATAVAVSQDSFPAGNAGAVVLARGDDYPDALVGGPLAAAKNAPLLLTEGSTLPAATATELKRVLPAGATVYVLGGTSAVPASVAAQLASFGYKVARYSGADRYATAVAVATALGSPTTVLLATGTNFPDALAAGPAAAHVHGAILLTDGSNVPAETATYLAGAHVTYAIGGPAAAAVPSATAILGSDRYATAAAVATRFFPASAVVGVATGAGFPDALAGGAQLALMGAPLLLSSLASVPTTTSNYLSADHSVLTNVYVYGGTAVLGANVVGQLTAAFGS